MKTLAAAVLLIAVSAWGQSKPIVAPCLHGNIKVSGPVKLINCLPPKPHKPKPSVKTEHDIRCDEEGCHDVLPCDGWSCTKPVEVRPMKKFGPGKIHDGALFGKWDEPVEEFHWSCLGDCGGVPEGTKWEIIPFNNDAILPQQTTKPVEIQQWGDWPPDQHASDTPIGNCDDTTDECYTWYRSSDKATGDCFRGNVGHEKQIPCPDKAAVPAEPTFYAKVETPPDGAIILRTPTQAAILLSDSEYSHLEQLRQDLADEKLRLAIKYGAQPNSEGCGLTERLPGSICPTKTYDHYEYKGQFLLIDKGGK